jgi:hypothetical protein
MHCPVGKACAGGLSRHIKEQRRLLVQVASACGNQPPSPVARRGPGWLSWAFVVSKHRTALRPDRPRLGIIPSGYGRWAISCVYLKCRRISGKSAGNFGTARRNRYRKCGDNADAKGFLRDFQLASGRGRCKFGDGHTHSSKGVGVRSRKARTFRGVAVRRRRWRVVAKSLLGHSTSIRHRCRSFCRRPVQGAWIETTVTLPSYDGVERNQPRD